MWILGREILKRAESCKHDREDTRHEEILSLIHVENLLYFQARRPLRADMWWLNLYKIHTQTVECSHSFCVLSFSVILFVLLFVVLSLFLNWSEMDMRALPLVVWEQAHGSGKRCTLVCCVPCTQLSNCLQILSVITHCCNEIFWVCREIVIKRIRIQLLSLMMTAVIVHTHTWSFLWKDTGGFQG